MIIALVLSLERPWKTRNTVPANAAFLSRRGATSYKTKAQNVRRREHVKRFRGYLEIPMFHSSALDLPSRQKSAMRRLQTLNRLDRPGALG
jgi:hypothetical protein